MRIIIIPPLREAKIYKYRFFETLVLIIFNKLQGRREKDTKSYFLRMEISGIGMYACL